MAAHGLLLCCNPRTVASLPSWMPSISQSMHAADGELACKTLFDVPDDWHVAAYCLKISAGMQWGAQQPSFSHM